MTRPCKCGECAFFKNEDAHTIYSITELLAVKNRTLNDPNLRLRRVVPFSSVGFAPTDFCHTHGSHSWGSADRDFDSRSGVRAFLFHVT